jgi:hypothetical protein
MNRRDKSIWKRLGGLGRPGEDWEDWKNTGGLSWKDKDDRKVTWMKDLDGQGGYLD